MGRRQLRDPKLASKICLYTIANPPHLILGAKPTLKSVPMCQLLWYAATTKTERASRRYICFDKQENSTLIKCSATRTLIAYTYDTVGELERSYMAKYFNNTSAECLTLLAPRRWHIFQLPKWKIMGMKMSWKHHESSALSIHDNTS